LHQKLHPISTKRIVPYTDNSSFLIQRKKFKLMIHCSELWMNQNFFFTCPNKSVGRPFRYFISDRWISQGPLWQFSLRIRSWNIEKLKRLMSCICGENFRLLPWRKVWLTTHPWLLWVSFRVLRCYLCILPSVRGRKLKLSEIKVTDELYMCCKFQRSTLKKSMESIIHIFYDDTPYTHIELLKMTSATNYSLMSQADFDVNLYSSDGSFNWVYSALPKPGFLGENLA